MKLTKNVYYSNNNISSFITEKKIYKKLLCVTVNRIYYFFLIIIIEWRCKNKQWVIQIDIICCIAVKKNFVIYSAACWNKFKSSLYMHRDFYTDYLFYYKSSTCVPCIFWIILLYIN